jgi:hypothetical protein
MGRKKIYKGGREEIGIYLTPEEFEAFEEIRWRERKDKTELGREALLEYIKGHREGNDTFKIDDWKEDPSFQAVPSILTSWEKWKKYLEECDKRDFFKVLKALTDRRQQAIDIMNKRNLKWEEEKKPVFVLDKNATSHYVPMTLGDK